MHFNLRDRAKLKFIVEYYAESEYDDAKICIAAVNEGRRPLILLLSGGCDLQGKNWVAEGLGENGRGIRLGEHERHDWTVYRNDLAHMGPVSDKVYDHDDLWVEDSLGQRHAIPKARESIRRLKATGPIRPLYDARHARR